jgi:hypothetical protein
VQILCKENSLCKSCANLKVWPGFVQTLCKDFRRLGQGGAGIHSPNESKRATDATAGHSGPCADAGRHEHDQSR